MSEKFDSEFNSEKIHSETDAGRTGAEYFSFYYFMLLYCLGHMLTAMVLSQHRVFPSITIRFRAPNGA